VRLFLFSSRDDTKCRRLGRAASAGGRSAGRCCRRGSGWWPRRGRRLRRGDVGRAGVPDAAAGRRCRRRRADAVGRWGRRDHRGDAVRIQL